MDRVQVTRLAIPARISGPHRAALGFLALTYGGVLPLLGAVSRPLLYVGYIGLLGCLLLGAAAESRAYLRVRCLAPYLCWLGFYSLWGALVSWNQSLAADEGVRLVLRNCFFMSALVIAVGDRRHLQAFARLIGWSAVVNCGLCVWELTNPSLIENIAYALDPQATAFNVLRPAGLWSNPNEAAFAFVFAVLLSHWDRGPCAWLARAAALVGIYLTASRGGLLLIAFCGLAHLVFMLRARPAGVLRRGVFLGAASAAALCLIVLGNALPKDHGFWERYVVQRFLYGDKGSPEIRGVLALRAAEIAVNGPWYGHGLFTFHGMARETRIPSVIDETLGAHNIYLVVFGETGLVGLFGYGAVLGLGLFRLFTVRAAGGDRHIALLFWLSYLLIGFLWHNQLTSLGGMLYVALLYHLPGLVARNLESARFSRPLPSGAIHA